MEFKREMSSGHTKMQIDLFKSQLITPTPKTTETTNTGTTIDKTTPSKGGIERIMMEIGMIIDYLNLSSIHIIFKSFIIPPNKNNHLTLCL